MPDWLIVCMQSDMPTDPIAAACAAFEELWWRDRRADPEAVFKSLNWPQESEQVSRSILEAMSERRIMLNELILQFQKEFREKWKRHTSQILARQMNLVRWKCDCPIRVWTNAKVTLKANCSACHGTFVTEPFPEANPRPVLEEELRKSLVKGDPESKRYGLFREYLPIEIEYRRKLLERLDPHEYTGRFPVAWHKAIFRLLDSVNQPFKDRFAIEKIRDDQGVIRERILRATSGQGDILAAHDTRFDRPVLIKRTREDDRSSHDAIRREALTLDRLKGLRQHRHLAGVPEVYDHGHVDNAYCLAEERIRHPEDREQLALTFDVLIARFHNGRGAIALNNPEFATLLRWFVQICNTMALVHGHARGILHRDLKPTNLAIDRNQRPYILDWGLAFWMVQPTKPTAQEGDAEHQMSHASRGGGTPGYRSPEQARTPHGPLGPHTDIFGLGACLFKLVTNESVYDCASGRWFWQSLAFRPARRDRNVRRNRKTRAELWNERAKAYDEAPDPRCVRHDVDPVLARIIQKALNADPAKRHASFNDLEQELLIWMQPELPMKKTIWAGLRRAVCDFIILFLFVVCLAITALLCVLLAQKLDFSP